jgi:transposase
MKPYSEDLRLRVIETIQANELSQAEIAEQFSVSLPFVEKLWHRFRTTGDYRAKTKFVRGPERLLKNDEELIRELVKNQPDATLEELSR